MIKNQSTISLNAEIPEVLYKSITDFIETHPGWDQDRFMQAATSLMLLQNGASQPHVSCAYLDSLFGCAA